MANAPKTETKTEAKAAVPSVKVGDVLLYKVEKDDASERNLLRNTAADKHEGHKVAAGDVVPLIVTKLGNDGRFSGQAFLDGNDTLWVKNTTLGDDDGQCTVKG